MIVFGEQWFKYHQPRLLRFANTPIGRYALGLESAPVISISPGGVSYIRGLDIKKQALICQNFARRGNPYAARLRKYGKFLWLPMHFADWTLLDRQRLIPSFGFATYYSATGNNPNYDAQFYFYSLNQVWSTLRTTTYANVSATVTSTIQGVGCGTTTDRYNYIYRSAWQFDTSAIGLAARVTAASVYHDNTGVSLTQLWSTSNYNDIVWVEFTPAFTSSANANDIDNIQSTILGTIAWSWSSPPSTTTLSTSAVKKDASTRLMSLIRGDLLNSAPDQWSSGAGCHMTLISVDQTYSDPYLSVTYEFPIRVNIGDTWKNVQDIQVNIGDSWKSLSELKINISDVWKTVF